MPVRAVIAFSFVLRRDSVQPGQSESIGNHAALPLNRRHPGLRCPALAPVVQLSPSPSRGRIWLWMPLRRSPRRSRLGSRTSSSDPTRKAKPYAAARTSTVSFSLMLDSLPVRRPSRKTTPGTGLLLASETPGQPRGIAPTGLSTVLTHAGRHRPRACSTASDTPIPMRFVPRPFGVVQREVLPVNGRHPALARREQKAASIAAGGAALNPMWAMTRRPGQVKLAGRRSR
jgi:hypothetical protein